MTRVKEFNLPDLGEGLVEGEILKWLVSVGEVIELNQPIVEVETAKAAVEIPAKWAGQVTAIFHEEGAVVEVGSPIIRIDTEPGSPLPDQQAPSAEPAEKPQQVLVGYGPRAASLKRRPRKTDDQGVRGEPASVQSRTDALPPPAPVTQAPAPIPAPAPVAEPVAEPAVARVPVALAKPPVRKLARDLGVALTGLSGTGPHGSITRDDVLAAQRVQESPQPVVSGTPVQRGEREERIPVKGVRKLTAENMTASAFTAPHVTEFLTVDVTRTLRALDRLKARPEWRDVRVSPLLLVAKAVLVALKRHPIINASWAGSEIVVKHYVNLGIAAATERGLIVPNVKDADRLSLRELADALKGLVATAKEGRTAPADMAGGTFSITNIGVFGIDSGTPILPPGEAAILAFGVIREQPWAHKGKVKLRQVTTLGLSFDHRVIDGEQGSKFLRDVGVFLHDPEAALLAWG
jgi:2-oxoisovalerate dehydrogenase E2 component (dihydrolipoyl transacylase)